MASIENPFLDVVMNVSYLLVKSNIPDDVSNDQMDGMITMKPLIYSSITMFSR